MQVLGACGIICSECEAFKATKANDTEKLVELAKSWGSTENPLTADDMRCNGCMSDVVFKNALNCGVRGCAVEHNVANCGECSEFACQKLNDLWKGYKLNPDDMMKNLSKAQ